MEDVVYKKYTSDGISWIGPDVKTDIMKSDVDENEDVPYEFIEPDDPALTRIERFGKKMEEYKDEPYIYVIMSTYQSGDPVIFLDHDSFTKCFKKIMDLIENEIADCRYYSGDDPDIEGLLKGHQIIRATNSWSERSPYS